MVDTGANKVVGGAAGMGAGTAVSIILLALFWPDASPTIAAAFTTLCNALVSLPAVYFTPREPSR